ncbi:hypothetical protein TWF281_007064 [Arthrobotrys megalospora]
MGHRIQLKNRTFFFILIIGSVLFNLPTSHARPSGHGTKAASSELEVRNRIGVPVPGWEDLSKAEPTNPDPLKAPQPKCGPALNIPCKPLPLPGPDRTKEEDFNGRECKVGLYENRWFRSDKPGYYHSPYERWEGYPLGTWDSPIPEQCWEVEDLNPRLIEKHTLYSVITGHCGCKFYTARGCDESAWLYSGHDTSGPTPNGYPGPNILSFRCRPNDHFDDFQYCNVYFSNGGDEKEPGGRYNLVWNRLDGYDEHEFWYKVLSFDRNTIKEGYGQGSQGSVCYNPGPEEEREIGRAQYIRYAKISGCSCSLYEHPDCQGNILRELGGYGTDLQWNWPSTPYTRPGSVRCWLPYGLSYGPRDDGGPERTNWGE